jgi:drug/metabolite transporter, DME family
MARAVFTGKLLADAGGGQRLGPLILSQTRVTLSFLVLLPALLLLRGRSAFRMPARDVVRCLLIGTAGIAASNYFYYVAVQKTTVATAITLQYLCPILVLTWMVARGLQRATAQRVIAVLLAVAGCALAIGLGRAEIRLVPTGVAAGLGAAVAFGFYNVMGRGLLERYDRWAVFTYAMLGASVFWAVVNPPWKIADAHYSAAQWEFMGVFALVSILIGYSLYFSGLAQLDATRAVVTSCLEPVFAILLTATFLAEGLSWSQALGVVLVLVGTIIIQVHGVDSQQ